MFLYDSDHDHSESSASNPSTHLHKQFKEDSLLSPERPNYNSRDNICLSNSTLNESFKNDDDHYENLLPKISLNLSDSQTQSFKKSHSNARKFSLDLPNKFFSYHYHMNFYTQHDFIFEFSNSSNHKILIEKTSKLRGYPLHLKATLFASEKERLIRQREYPLIEVSFNELKEIGNRLYRRNKFREALNIYIEAYGLLKWIELKDKESYGNIIKNQTPILDDDVIEQSCLGDDCGSYSFNDNIMIILLCLSYTFIELRHYKNAIECLDECLSYDEMNTTALFRRSQARIYNKNSNEDEIQLAVNDIKKAMMIYSESNSDIPLIYKEHFDILNAYITQRKDNEEQLVKNFIQEAVTSFDKCEDRLSWLRLDKKALLLTAGDDTQSTGVRKQDTQWKVLKIMKKEYKTIVKYHNETKNEEQLAIAGKEIDCFMDDYKKFKFFYCLDISQAIRECIDNNTRTCLNEIEGESFKNYLLNHKDRTVNAIFQAGNFNTDLIKYAIRKVDKEIKRKGYLEINSNDNDYSYQSTHNKTKGWDFLKKNELPKNLSLPISMLLLCISIAIIFTHYFLFFLNPHKLLYIRE